MEIYRVQVQVGVKVASDVLCAGPKDNGPQAVVFVFAGKEERPMFCFLLVGQDTFMKSGKFLKTENAVDLLLPLLHS